MLYFKVPIPYISLRYVTLGNPYIASVTWLLPPLLLNGIIFFPFFFFFFLILSRGCLCASFVGESVVGTAHFLLSRTLIQRLSLRVRLSAGRHDVLWTDRCPVPPDDARHSHHHILDVSSTPPLQ